VLCGIHDSNASLFPHLLARAAPFAVVSTGTWVVAMAVGADGVALNPARDVLVNVSALGQPVPSARFMGGREYEVIRAGAAPVAGAADAVAVLARRLMLLPSVVPDSGPFQGRAHNWTHDVRTVGETEVALGYYLALMTAECLATIGAQGPVLVEGPFGENLWYAAMLAAATGRAVLRSEARTGTAVGAALLFQAEERQPITAALAPVIDPRLAAYAQAWRAAVAL
jgi:sugar (pentulose or hexulose) kinase